MATKSTQSTGTSKQPRKRKTAYPLPYDGFPLSPHVPTNRWYKTRAGRRYYFGPLDDWEAALAKYERDWPQILQGRKPRPSDEEQQAEGLTLAVGVNRWLAARVEDGEAGVIAASTVRTYYEVAGWVLGELGRQTPVSWLGPDDFRRLAKVYRGMSDSQAKKAFTVTRQIFRWLHENEHIPAPPRFGTDFKLGKLASRQVAHGQQRGRDIFTAEQVRELLAAAEQGVKGKRWQKGNREAAGVAPSQQLRCMILLALNGGYTQSELAVLRVEDLDLDAGIINHRRAKTGARRTVPLWPEVVEALREVLACRPTPRAEAEGLLFVTKRGWPWVRERLHVDEEAEANERLRSRRVDSVRLQFNKLLDATGIKGQGLGFGRLRHTHRTISDEVNNPHAALRVMGHGVPGISRHYVQDISRERLDAVVNHVRAWLWPPEPKKKKSTKKKGTRKKASK